MGTEQSGRDTQEVKKKEGGPNNSGRGVGLWHSGIGGVPGRQGTGDQKFPQIKTKRCNNSETSKGWQSKSSPKNKGDRRPPSRNVKQEKKVHWAPKDKTADQETTRVKSDKWLGIGGENAEGGHVGGKKQKTAT